MADNPVYQRQNITLADTQPLQFADFQESIKSSKSLIAGLDKISKFAMESQTEKAKKAGAEYGASNRPSLQQIMDAVSRKQDPKELFSEDYTIFGQNAVAAQAATVKADFELEAKSELSRIQGVIDSGIDINRDDIRSTLDGMINGYSNILAKIDPEQSLKFRASVGTASQELLRHADAVVSKKYVAQQEIKVEESFTNFSSQIGLLVENNNPMEFKLKAATYIADINDHIAMLPGEAQLKYAKRAKEIVDNAVVNSLINYGATDKTFFTDSYDVMNKVNQGIFGDKTDYYASLGEDDKGNSLKDKVRDGLRKRFNDLDSTRKEVQSAQTDKDKITVQELEASFYKNSDPKILVQLNAIAIRNPNAITANQIESIRKSAETETEYNDNVVKLKSEVGRKWDTLEGMYARAVELGVSRKAANKYASPLLNKADAYVDEKLVSYSKMFYPPQSTDRIKANIQYAKRIEIDKIIESNDAYNKSVNKIEKPTNRSDILDGLMDKKDKVNKANKAVNTQLSEFEAYLRNKNIKNITYPEDPMDEKKYQLFIQSIRMKKLNATVETDIINHLDAIHKSELAASELR